MVTITPAAAKQISVSIEQSNASNMPLRIAIKAQQNSHFHYSMGFDDNTVEGDKVIESEGVSIVLDEVSQALADGMTLDFVELEGKPEFIFLNPNDPNFKEPTEK